MSRNIHYMIKSEYERRQKAARNYLDQRKSEVYLKVPQLEEVEREINFSGLRYTKQILAGSASYANAADLLSKKIQELKKEKETLLAICGYPPDYLDMRFSCPKCKDTGYIETGSGAERCTCYKQQLINHLYAQSNLKLIESENFSFFDENYYPAGVNEREFGIHVSPRENILAIKDRCLEFIRNFSSPEEKNLFFSGPTGVGKTFMSNCIAAELLNKGITVLYQTAPVLFNSIYEYKLKSFKDDEYEDDSYKNIFDVELLIIDDLGTEPKSSAKYAEFLNILNTRNNNNLSRPCKTIISTNIGIKELFEYYDERVASRIIGSFDIYRFIGRDIRRVKQQ